MNLQLDTSQYFGVTLNSFQGEGYVVTETRCDSGLPVPEHEHQRPYVCFVIAGAYRESHGVQEYDCETLRAIYRPAGYAHSNVISPVGALCLNVEFESERFELPTDSRQLCLPIVSETAFRIFKEIRLGDQDTVLSIESHVGALCSHLSQIKTSDFVPLWIAQAKDKLREEISESWTLQRLADEACVHPVHFCRQFHRSVGLSIGEYVRHTRIELAIGLLRQGDLSLGEVATEVGFADQAHFARTFRSTAGMSPTQFRRALAS